MVWQLDENTRPELDVQQAAIYSHGALLGVQVVVCRLEMLARSGAQAGLGYGRVLT